jgi:hypothetical protein
MSDRFEPITEERLATVDAGRLQAHFRSRLRKLAFMVCMPTLRDYARMVFEDKRDAAAEACLEELLAYMKERRADPKMKFLLLSTIKTLCTESSVFADAMAFFRDKGILDP